jgi:uncharacterized protein (DUF2062 family)
MKLKRKNKSKWFLNIRGSYIPRSTAGWLTYIPFLAYMLIAPYLAVNYSENLVVAVLITIPNWIAATLAMTYLATQKS